MFPVGRLRGPRAYARGLITTFAVAAALSFGSLAVFAEVSLLSDAAEPLIHSLIPDS